MKTNMLQLFFLENFQVIEKKNTFEIWIIDKDNFSEKERFKISIHLSNYFFSEFKHFSN